MDNQQTDLLVNQILDEFSQGVDIGIALEISERISAKRKLTKDVLEMIRQSFKHKNSDVTLKGVLLLETLVKNCNQWFHLEVNDPKFQESLLKLLKIRRGKANLVEKMTAKKENWKKIEDKVLYLIQLWADTFMMAEDDYMNIMNNYKILRKEGIQFPARDPSEKFMIDFKGAKSPIFEVLDEVSKREQEQERKNQLNKENYDRQKRGLNPKKYVPQKDKNDSPKKPQIDITQQEVDSLRENLQLLMAITENAQQNDELNTEFTAEILGEVNRIKEKISKAYKFKCFRDDNHKALCVDVYQQAKRMIQTYEERSQELQQLDQAIEESVKDEIKHQNAEQNKQKLKSFKPSYPGQKRPSTNNNIEEQKEDNNIKQQAQEDDGDDIDLLDMDAPPLEQNKQNTQNNKDNIQNQQKSTPQTQQQQQQIEKKPEEDLMDLLSNPTTNNQFQNQQQQNNNFNINQNIGQLYNNNNNNNNNNYNQNMYQQQQNNNFNNNMSSMQQQQQQNLQQGFNQMQINKQQPIQSNNNNNNNKESALLFDDGLGGNKQNQQQNQQQQQQIQNNKNNQQQQQQNDVDDLFGDVNSNDNKQNNNNNQNKNIQKTDDLDDLFGDNPQPVVQQNQPQKTEDDDFFDDL